MLQHIYPEIMYKWNKPVTKGQLLFDNLYGVPKVVKSETSRKMLVAGGLKKEWNEELLV